MDKYKIEGRLGAGGQGETFLATRGFQQYALKLVDDPERAVREADKLASAGNHSNVVTVFEVVSMAAVDGLPHRDDDGAFVVMDYLNGATLRDTLHSEGQLTPNRWRTMLLPLLDGLRHIHDCGLIHRDIKPENIMLLEGGSAPVLIDLGLAKRLGSTPTFVGGHRDYQPPEWRDGYDHDKTYDIYQFGLVSYEALFGELLSDRDQMRGELQGNSSPFISSLGKALENSPTSRPRNVWDWVASMISAPSSVDYSDDEHLHHSLDWSKSADSSLDTIGAVSSRTVSAEVRPRIEVPTRDVTGDFPITLLCEEIQRDYKFPVDSIVVLNDAGKVVNGKMYLKNHRAKVPRKHAYTLGQLASQISKLYGVKVGFLRPGNDSKQDRLCNKNMSILNFLEEIW